MPNEKTLILKDPTLKSGFTSVPNIVLTSDLSFGAKVIYALLLMFAWQDKETFPGQARLAQAAGCTERTVRTYLNELKEAGLITWKRRGLTQTNVYYINKLDSNLDRKYSSDQDWKHSDRKSVSYPDRKQISDQDEKQVSDKEYSDQEYSDQKDTVLDRVTNDSLRSSLVTRGQQKSEQETDIQNFNIETSEITLESDLTSPGVFNKKIPVENVTVFKQETISSEPGINNKRAHVEREPELNQEALFTETGVNNKKPPVEKEPDLYQKTLPKEETLNNNIPAEKESILNQEQIFTETGVNNKKSTVEKELNLTQDTLSTRTDGINNQMPVESESILEQGEISTETGVNNKKSTAERELNINQDTLSIGTGGINNMPVEKEPDLNQETSTVEVTPQITNADLITALGDSLREAWDGPPAKAYAIAGRMYYLYDYPAAEAAINIFSRRVEQGFKPKNPVAYLMKVAREKKKEFESQCEEPQLEELDYFSAKYPEEHKKRVAEAKRVSAEHERYLKDYRDFLINKAPPIPGFITPGGCYKQLQEGGMKCN